MKKQVFFTIILLFASILVNAQWAARYDLDGTYEAQEFGAAGPQILIDGASNSDVIIIYNKKRLAIVPLGVGVEITIQYNFVDTYIPIGGPVASSVTFSGILEFGEELTGSYTYHDNEGDMEGSTTFQWYRADDGSGVNKTLIAGATSSTYTLLGDDQSKYIAFEVTPVALTGPSPGASIMSPWQGAVAPNQAPVASSVSFSGTLEVGEELTGSYTYSDNEGDVEGSTTYQWYRADDGSGANQTLIADATSSTYTLVEDDEGKHIAIEVTPVAQTGTSPGAAVMSQWQGAVNQAPVASGVTFSGTLEVDEELTGSYAYNDSEGDVEGSSTFQWYRSDDVSGTNPNAISGATSSSYTLVGNDEGKYIAFNVTPAAQTGTSPGAAVMSPWQGAVTINQAPVASIVTFSGSLDVGEELTGSYTYNDNEGDEEGSSSFQWYRADDASGTNYEAISGETSSSYTLVGDDEGKYIAFKVTPAAQTGTSPGAAVMSPWQGAVNQAPVASSVNFSGILEFGEELTGSYTYNDNEGDAEGSSTFQWYRADGGSGHNQAAIAGATSSTYTLVGDDQSKYIAFEVTPAAQTGTSPGSAVMSPWQGAVAPNQAPVASNVTISGTLDSGEELTGSYTYSDNESDAEGSSTFQWYRADDGAGSNQAAIAGATSSTYTLVGDDKGKYIAYKVTPAAQTGTSPGIAVMSTPEPVFICSDDVTFTYNGQSVTYGTVSGQNGTCWLDRNLGASQVATSSDDTDAYGDLYQWGRSADGHQIRTSGTTSTNATTALPNEGNTWDGLFITEESAPDDWLTPQDHTLWQGVNFTNNPCPDGYRLPTEAEWNAERATWSWNGTNGAIAAPLKLPAAANRRPNDGSFNPSFLGTYGFYWSITIEEDPNTVGDMLGLFFRPGVDGISSYGRASGFSVRCIKD